MATDLDEKKKIYADLGISEYWVIDVRGVRVFAFRLQENGKYTECTESIVLQGLPISLLDQALERTKKEANTRVAAWLAQQVACTAIRFSGVCWVTLSLYPTYNYP